MVGIVGLGDLVPVDPFGAVLVDYSHLDAIFVDALDHPAVALEGTASHSDGFANFQLLLLCASSEALRRSF